MQLGSRRVNLGGTISKSPVVTLPERFGISTAVTWTVLELFSGDGLDKDTVYLKMF